MLYFGMATLSQLTAHNTSRAYKEEYAKAWAQYDPGAGEQAARRDGPEDGLGDQAADLSNGQPMQMSFDINGPHPIHEMVTEYWRKVGVQVDTKTVLRTVLRPKIYNQMIMSAWGGDEIIDTLPVRRPKWFARSTATRAPGPRSGQVVLHQGKEGEVPPPEIKELYDWIDKYAETDDIQYVDKLLAGGERLDDRHCRRRPVAADRQQGPEEPA